MIATSADDVETLAVGLGSAGLAGVEASAGGIITTNTTRAEAGGKDGKGKQAQPGGKGQPQKGDKAPKGPKGEKGEAGEKKPRAPQERVTPRLRTHFDDVVRKQLTEERGYKNKMEVPKLQKIVINMGIGEAVNDRKKVEALVVRMEAEMRQAAKELEFERAAALRDEIQNIRLRVLEQDASVTVARAAERAAHPRR